MSSEARPAFYALAPGGWRDYASLLHPPYTLWHLSYVVIGACLAPHVPAGRTALAVGAFFLALGVGGHALDELRGRPLRTRIPARILAALAAASVAGAVAIGVGVAVTRELWLLPFVAFGGFIVCAYNLELFAGRFHSDLWFALAWGAFPLLTGYFNAAGRITSASLLAATFAALLSAAQRALSTPVRAARRRLPPLDPAELDAATRAPETALRLLAAGTVALATALVVLRLP